MRLTTRVALVAAVLSAPAACAHRPLPGPPPTITIETLRAAPEALAAAQSGRFELHVTVDGLRPEGEVASSGVFAHGVTAMDIDLGDVVAQAAHASGQPVLDGFDGESRIVIDASTMYVRVPMLHELTGEPGWLSMTSDDLGTQGARGFGASALNPVRLVDTLREVVGDVREVGGDVVRGVSTTHVTATLPGGQAVDVWMDADDLVRRLHFIIDDPGSGLGAVTTTVDLFDYGAPVAVEVPGPSETTAFSDLVRGFMEAGA